MVSIDDLNNLSKQLYPDGLAFRQLFGSDGDKLHRGINSFLLDIFNDFIYSQEILFPDSDKFTEEDAEYWEYYFGITTNSSIVLADRKKIILQRIRHPGNIRPRQTSNYLESQLRLAGFDVWVHENTPPYQTPADILGTGTVNTQMGVQMGGGSQMGQQSFSLIANSIDPNETFVVGAGNEWSTFFIGGENLGDYANIHPTKLRTFRELVLKIKPAHLCCYLFITTKDLEMQQELQYIL